jgi:hypothetical protein
MKTKGENKTKNSPTNYLERIIIKLTSSEKNIKEKILQNTRCPALKICEPIR